MNETITVKRELNASEKSIDPCQPAQSAQADMGRKFSLFFNFSACQKTFYITILSVVWRNGFYNLSCSVQSTMEIL